MIRIFIAFLVCASLRAQPGWPPDPKGRHVIPHGFVTLTGDLTAPYNYTIDDYRRMIPLGANVQVIRLFAGRLGAWPGYQLDASYLEQIDRMIGLGKQVGVRSIFKMTIYDIRGSAGAGARISFGEKDWTDFWNNAGGRQDKMIEAWRALFVRYKKEPAVIGYDLLNECHPIKPDVPVNEFLAKYLVPYYQKAIDVLQSIDSEKWALVQPPIGAPPVEMAIHRKRFVYAPHFYPEVFKYIGSGEPDTSRYTATAARFAAEARAMGAPLVIGEFGNPILLKNDDNPEKQKVFQKAEQAAVKEFDRHAVGAIRPWFTGSRHPITLVGALLTWGIFRGESDAGGSERAYVTDVFARPVPLAIAGRILSYGFDFDTREFSVEFEADPSKGESEIYVPRQRHFSSGFRISRSDGLSLDYDASAPNGFRADAGRGKEYRWDEARQKLFISKWPAVKGPVTLKISPVAKDLK